jgi:uncharacterized membrane protein YfcA
MDYLSLVIIGILMGLYGGLLGIGGSVVMIPALVLLWGENQHLYQASAMICNFFVACSSALAHREANALMPDIVKWLVPAAVVGVLAGVALSNSALFASGRSYNLARLFCGFLIYVVIYNCFRLIRSIKGASHRTVSDIRRSVPLTILSGFVTGLGGGLLGMGGGAICVPLQQLLLKMPLRKAIANSAVTIIFLSLIGALYKNLTLASHDIELTGSLKIAVVIIPTAAVGGFFGGRLTHALPRNVVRVAFILLAMAAAYKMLTIPAGT